MQIPPYILPGNLICSLLQPTLWFIWLVHMHNSLTHRSYSPSHPQEEFLHKILKLRDFFAFYTSHMFTFLHNTTTLLHRKKKEKNLTRSKSDSIKWHFYLVPRSLQRTFEQFSYLLPLKISDWKQCHNLKCSWNTDKLRLQRRKNRHEMKAFLFNCW